VKEFILSLSFSSGALIVAVVSFIIGLVISGIKSRKLKWMISLIVPFFVAYILYFSPVFFFGSDPSEYSAWSGIFIIPWYAAGLFGSVIVIFIMKRNKDADQL
jgi:hypothetical protein